MPEPTTETTQQTTATTTQQTTEQGAAGATTTPAPSQTSTEQTGTQTQTQQQPASKPTPEEVQRRIDRMYARLQEERRQRVAAEAALKLRQQPTQQTTDEGEGGEAQTQQPQLTEADVQRAAEQAVERKERDRRFIASETKVLQEHPTALDTNGNFNMADPWVKRYIEIGKQNPGLALLENGPELAAAMVDKELGVDFKKGRITEAQRTAQTDQSFTTSSTTMPTPAAGTVALNEVEQKVAKRMGMSNDEYAKQKGSNKVVQKDWEVKVR